MKRMTRNKRMTTVAAAGLAMTLLGWSPALAQTVVVSGKACESGVVEGSLGIAGLDCVGECTLTLSSDGKEEMWVFSTEPRVFSVEAGGPTDGILEAGDFLVAVDGLLITTREGGRRYANLNPGETVTLRYRRDGRVRDAMVRVGTQCVPEPTSVVGVGRALPAPPSRPAREPRGIAATVPRVRVLPDSMAVVPPLATAVAPVPPEPLLDSTPRGRLGIGLACEECGTRTDEETGRSLWFFSGPIEVTQVNVGGPAERAGIQLGDLITAIDGHDISSEAGGRAFSDLTPGEAVRVTVVRRTGREAELTVVPEETGTRLRRGRLEPPQAAAVAEPPRGVAGVSVAPPAAPVGRVGAEPLSAMRGPEDLPLSYSKTLSGVEVTVRGGPVAVSELRGARTIIINANGLWIRIRVPSGGEG